jgi:hypothetical protein
LGHLLETPEERTQIQHIRFRIVIGPKAMNWQANQLGNDLEDLIE